MSFTVTQVEGGDGWERFATGLGASPLVSTRWLAAVSSPERVPIHLRVEGPSGTSGAIAGLIQRPSNPLFRPWGRSLFFYTGPALSVSDPRTGTQAVEAIVDFARRIGMSAVDFRSWDQALAYELPEVLPYRLSRAEYLLDVSGDMSAVDARMRSQVHRQMRQALDAGLTFEPADSVDAVDDLLRLVDETRSVRRDKGYGHYDYFYMPHLSRDALVRALQSGLAQLFRVRRESDVLSVVFILTLGRRAAALLIGTAAEGYRLRAPSLMWHEVARALNLAGVHRLNFLGVPSGVQGEKLAFFKMSLGCEKVPLGHGKTRLLHRTPPYLLVKFLSKR